jgi:cyclopropane fatty-acyl-phospholipid synthase-like methyltransferase
VVLFFLILFFAHPFFSRVPFVPARRRAVSEIVSHFELKQGDIFYELGCGDGRILFETAKRYPDVLCVGYELSPLPYLLAKSKALLRGQKNVEVRYGNLFKADVSDASYIFAYLLPEVMDKLIPKMEREVKPDSRLFSLDFKCKDEIKRCLAEIQINNGGHLNRKLFVYEF